MKGNLKMAENKNAIIHESDVIKNNLEQYPELLVLADL